jgi:hypothetical protein
MTFKYVVYWLRYKNSIILIHISIVVPYAKLVAEKEHTCSLLQNILLSANLYELVIKF